MLELLMLECSNYREKTVRIIDSSNDWKLKLVKCIRVKPVLEKSILEIS